MLLTELGLRNGESCHFGPSASFLEWPERGLRNFELVVFVVAAEGNTFVLGTTDAGKELIDERPEVMAALSRLASWSVDSS